MILLYIYIYYNERLRAQPGLRRSEISKWGDDRGSGLRAGRR